MKLRFLPAVALLAVCAMGQGPPTATFWRKGDPKILLVPNCPAGFDCLWFDAEGAIHLPTVMCGKSVKLGNSTRAIKEVFPKECRNKHAELIMDGGDGSDSKAFNFNIGLSDSEPSKVTSAPKHWRIDWTTPQGVPTPKIGECYQVVDDGERGSELKKVECRKPQPELQR